MNGPKTGPFVKIALLLNAIKWYNIGLLGLSQYLVAYFVFNSNQNLIVLFSDFKLHLIVFSTTCAVAGAFIINAFYDVNKDLVNRPQAVVFSRLLSQNYLLNVYVALNATSVFIALFASYKVFIFSVILTFLFWFYSHKLQKLPVIRELSASILAIAPIIAVWLHFFDMHYGLLIYLCSLLALGFTRELVKDLNGNKGNIIFGYITVVVAAGKRFTKQWLFVIILLSNLAFLLGTSLFYKQLDYFVLISAFSMVSSLIVSLASLLSKKDDFFIVADSLLKIAIVIHIASLAAMEVVNQELLSFFIK